MPKFKRDDKIIAISGNIFKVPIVFIVKDYNEKSKYYTVADPKNKQLHTVTMINIETHFRLAEQHEVETHF